MKLGLTTRRVSKKKKKRLRKTLKYTAEDPKYMAGERRVGYQSGFSEKWTFKLRPKKWNKERWWEGSIF